MASSAGLCGGTEASYTPALQGVSPHLTPPQYLPVIEATSESEHTAGQVAQPDVVALQDNITQRTALQGW